MKHAFLAVCILVGFFSPAASAIATPMPTQAPVAVATNSTGITSFTVSGGTPLERYVLLASLNTSSPRRVVATGRFDDSGTAEIKLAIPNNLLASERGTQFTLATESFRRGATFMLQRIGSTVIVVPTGPQIGTPAPGCPVPPCQKVWIFCICKITDMPNCPAI